MRLIEMALFGCGGGSDDANNTPSALAKIPELPQIIDLTQEGLTIAWAADGRRFRINQKYKPTVYFGFF